METWDLWYPGGGADGLPFARARIDPADVVLVHAAPRRLRVEVRDDAGNRLAFGDDLRREGDDVPVTRLVRVGGRIRREDGWPRDDDVGRAVLLPGGEAGRLLSWWNAADGSEWRWQVEFYNRRR
ncbi:MAG TPA: hypothetical protein VNM91_06030 [Dehalococcoidia bacterium]|nr:hypothetical protein [Dehalococcoidia bacterium]